MSRFLKFLLVVPAFLLLLEQPAQAYVDPGTGSLLLQLLLGGVAGAAVLLKLFWHRILRFFGLEPKEIGPYPEGEAGELPGEVKDTTESRQLRQQDEL